MQSFNNVSVLSINMEGKERFFKVYSGLPLEERDKVIVIIEGEPINWNLAYQEIKNNTKNGMKILDILKELEII